MPRRSEPDPRGGPADLDPDDLGGDEVVLDVDDAPPSPDATNVEKVEYIGRLLAKKGWTDSARVNVIRDRPTSYNGENTKGQCEGIDWIADPNDLLAYVEKRWGGHVFRLQTYIRPPNTNRNKYLPQIKVEFSAEPLLHGQRILRPGELSPPEGGAPAAQMVAVVREAEAAKREAAEGRTETTIEFLRDQNRRLEDRLHAMEDRLAADRGRPPPVSVTDRPEFWQTIKGDGGASISSAVENVRTSLETRFATERATLDAENTRLRDKIADMERDHRKDIESVKSECERRVEAIRKEAKDDTNTTIARLREDHTAALANVDKGAGDRLKIIESQLTEARAEVKDLRKSNEALRDHIADVPGTVEKVMSLRGMFEGTFGSKSEDDSDKPWWKQVMADPEGAMGMAQAAGTFLNNALGAPRPQPQAAPGRRYRVRATGSGPPPVGPPPSANQPPQPPPPPPTTEQEQLLGILRDMERALQSSTPAEGFAANLASTRPSELLSQAVAFGADAIIEQIKGYAAVAGSETVLVSPRGKRYIRDVLSSLSTILNASVAPGAVAPESIEVDESDDSSASPSPTADG